MRIPRVNINGNSNGEFSVGTRVRLKIQFNPYGKGDEGTVIKSHTICSLDYCNILMDRNGKYILNMSIGNLEVVQ